MRLLTKQEVRASKTSEQERLIGQLSTLNAFINKKNKEINDLKTEYEAQEMALNEHFAKENERLNTALSLLKNEVKSLEERKREALKPITEKIKELEVKEAYILEKQEELAKEREQLIADRRENDDKIDEIMARLDLIKEQETIILQKTESLSIREREVVNSENRLKEKWDQMINHFKEKELSISERETATTLMVEAHNVLFKELEIQRADINREKKHIESQREALRAAFSEARLKGII